MTTESTTTMEEVDNPRILEDADGSSDAWALDNDYYTMLDTRDIYGYYVSVVPFCALLTNGLAVYVFLHRAKKTEQTVDLLLIAVSVSDIFSLVNFMDTAVYFWTDYEWSFQQKTDVGCRMIQYITNVARDCSSYFVLAFTVDRFVAVWFPLKRSTIMTKKSVRLIMVGIVLLGLTMEMYVPILYRYGHLHGVKGCQSGDMNLNAELLTYLRNTLGFIVPGVAVAILNALIIVRMRKYELQRAAMMSGHGEDSNSSYNRNTSLTTMLVTASTFSFLCATPKTIYFIYLSYTNWAGWEYLTYAYVVDMILVANYTCNFFFYCVSGSQFRRDLVKALCRRGEDISSRLLIKSHT